MDKFIIGNKYWIKNPKAGNNKQSCATLLGWDQNHMVATLFSDRWGYLYATLQNLEEHNNGE